MQRRPDGDVMMLARGEFQPQQQLLQRLEPSFGLPRTCMEQPGRPSAMLIDRAERPYVARRSGSTLSVVRYGPRPADCP